MKLYLITTDGLGDFYIVSEDPTSAGKRLITLLNESDYGFSKDRKVRTIKLMSEEVELFGVSKPKPNFSGGKRLILPTSCMICPTEAI